MTILVYGAVISAVYALLAVGFTLIFGVARILNLAHGAFYALGAYTVYVLTAFAGFPLAVAAICSVLFVAIFGIALERFLVRPLRPQGSLAILMITLAVGLMVEQILLLAFGSEARNVPSFVAMEGVALDVPGFGPLVIDIAYGGNFYAIVEPQGPYRGLDDLGAARIVELSRTIRAMLRDRVEPVHPLDDRIRGVTHLLWADVPKGEDADGRNAVFYGERAIDRSPCGTGTSARLAHLVHKGRLAVGDRFVHESYIGSRFIGRVEDVAEIGGIPGIVPSIEGSAIATGLNTIWIDREDPFWAGFSVL